MNTPEQQIHPATEKVAKAAHNAVDRIAEKGARAEETVRESSRRMTVQSQEVAESMRAYVSVHPFASMGMAAAAGFILAALIRR